MRITAGITLAVMLLGSAHALSAQSLADAARKESDRRKATKDGGKVYTNADLRPSAPPPPSETTAATSDAASKSGGATASATPAADSKTGDAGKTTDPKTGAKTDDEKTQKYWSTKAHDLREQLERDRFLADAMQARINGLTTDFVNRDDPAQRAQIGADRQKAVAELERLRKAVEADTKAVAALEEEARTKGIPPGWIR